MFAHDTTPCSEHIRMWPLPRDLVVSFFLNVAVACLQHHLQGSCSICNESVQRSLCYRAWEFQAHEICGAADAGVKVSETHVVQKGSPSVSESKEQTLSSQDEVQSESKQLVLTRFPFERFGISVPLLNRPFAIFQGSLLSHNNDSWESQPEDAMKSINKSACSCRDEALFVITDHDFQKHKCDTTSCTCLLLVPRNDHKALCTRM